MLTSALVVCPGYIIIFLGVKGSKKKKKGGKFLKEINHNAEVVIKNIYIGITKTRLINHRSKKNIIQNFFFNYDFGLDYVLLALGW